MATVLVTGAAAGIGFGIGAAFHAVDVRDAPSVEQFVAGRTR